MPGASGKVLLQASRYRCGTILNDCLTPGRNPARFAPESMHSFSGMRSGSRSAPGSVCDDLGEDGLPRTLPFQPSLLPRNCHRSRCISPSSRSATTKRCTRSSARNRPIGESGDHSGLFFRASAMCDQGHPIIFQNKHLLYGNKHYNGMNCAVN